MYAHDPVTTAYLNRFHAIERNAQAEVRRLTRQAEPPAAKSAPRRSRRRWSRLGRSPAVLPT